MKNYTNRFLNLKCAPEIIHYSQPIKNWHKEISETFAFFERIEEYLKEYKNKKFIHIDLCSGNALLPILTAFMCKNITWSYAIDIHKRNRDYSNINYFQYLNKNIFDFNIQELDPIAENNIIITGIHPCKNTSKRIIELFNDIYWGQKHLLLNPCCIGKIDYRKNEDKYKAWCKWLYEQININNLKEKELKIYYRNDNILSKRNIIIEAEKISEIKKD
jgi:hypothetical protein